MLRAVSKYRPCFSVAQMQTQEVPEFTRDMRRNVFDRNLMLMVNLVDYLFKSALL